MSLLVGACLGCSLLLLWFCGFPRPQRATQRRSWLRRRLDDAGLASTRTPAWLGLCIACAAAAAVIVFLLTSAWSVALVFGCCAAAVPLWALGPRAARRRREARSGWPDVVDQLRSAVRAGLPLSEALAHLGRRGPLALRAPFLEYEADLRAGRSVDASLERLRLRCDDPVADRLIAAVRLTREVGGADVGEMLGTLAAFLRADLHTRAELEARQSWSVNAARLAVAAPWIILLVLCLQPAVARAYTTPMGLLVLLLGLLAAALSYAAMVRVARLPDPEREARP